MVAHETPIFFPQFIFYQTFSFAFARQTVSGQ